MSSITLTGTRTHKAITLSWTATGVDTTANVILLSDEGAQPTRQTVLDAGTTSYTLTVDDSYYIANPSLVYAFVVMIPKNGDATTLVASNELSLAFIEVPTPNYTLVPLNEAFRIDFTDTLDNMDTYHDELAAANVSSYDPDRSVTNVVVTMTTTSPLQLIQAIYAIGSLDDNTLTVGLGGPVPTASSVAGIETNGLKNFQEYEVNVAYISDETGNGSLGRGEGSVSATNVVPTTLYNAPRNVTVVERADADTGAKIYFNAPSNDLNEDPSSYVTTVSKYQVYYTGTASDATSTPTFNTATPSGDWTLAGEYSPGSTDTNLMAYNIVMDGTNSTYDQPVGTKVWYTVRAIRNIVAPETDALDGTNDGIAYGAFCAPVEFVTFSHTALSAPTLTTFATVVDVAAVTYDATSPANATTLALTNTGYDTHELIVKVQPKDGTGSNYGSEQTFALSLGQTFADEEVTMNTLADDTTALEYGVTYVFTSAVYQQSGLDISLGTLPTSGLVPQSIGTTAVTYSSADAASSDQISGGSSISRTPYTTPAAPTGEASTAMDGSNLPLSTGTADGNGKLSFSWTSLASYDNGSGADSKFFSGIKYRVSGGTATPTSLSGAAENVFGASDADADADIEQISGSSTTVEDLNIGTGYSLTVQGYFWNDEMSTWVVGTASTAVTAGNVPFYYPADVTGLTLDASGNAAWNNPANNGVTASSEVSLYYNIKHYVNNGSETTVNEAATGVDGDEQSYSIGTTSVSNTYKVEVKSEYRVGETTTYKTNQSTSAVAYVAVPEKPTISLVAGDQTITATFTNATNDASMTFVRFEQALGADAFAANGTGTTDPATKTYTGLTNGDQYYVSVQAVYEYPSGGDEFTSAVTTTNQDATGIPYGVPDIKSVTVSGTDVTVSISNNGRALREALIVGIPLDTNIASPISYQRRLSTTTPAISAGVNDNTTRTVGPYTFGYDLKEALVVFENDAGSSASLG